MNKQAEAQELLSILQRVTPLHAAATADMLRRKAILEEAEQTYKLDVIHALGQALGKNAEQREADAHSQPVVIAARQQVEQARAAFNAAYAVYKEHDAMLLYVRDATALLREMV